MRHSDRSKSRQEQTATTEARGSSLDRVPSVSGRRNFKGRVLNRRLSSRLASRSTAERCSRWSRVAKGCYRKSTERTVGREGGGGQPGLTFRISGSTRGNQGAGGGGGGRITSNGLQTPSAPLLGQVQLPFRSVSSLGWGVSSPHSTLGSRTRTATKKRSGPHSRLPH